MRETIEQIIHDGHMPGVQSQVIHHLRNATQFLPDKWELQDGSTYTPEQLREDTLATIAKGGKRMDHRAFGRFATAIIEDCYAARRKPAVRAKKPKPDGSIWAGGGALPEYKPPAYEQDTAEDDKQRVLALSKEEVASLRDAINPRDLKWLAGKSVRQLADSNMARTIIIKALNAKGTK